MLETQSDVQLKQVQVCAEIGIECTNSNPAKRPDMQHIINRLGETKTMEGYVETGEITAQRVEYAPNELHKGTPHASGEASSEENSTEVTVAGTNPDNGFLQNTANLDVLNETMHRLDPDIRRCLEYCSIFPRGSMLRMGELVRLWIAQGFVKAGCATEDMEDVAGRYIKELVSCSFMQPIKTASGTGFRIHEVVHDLLDKVAKNCFRIENAPFKQKKFSLKKKGIRNARSRREEVWGGHVPRDVQHLFVQNYDGELITEEILGLENLRTLIIYVVQEDAPVEEKIIDSICKRLLELRVLAVAFSREHDPIKQANKFPVPDSISQLKHLSYLAFRTSSSWTVILPKTELNHIQVLDFGDGKIFEFTSAGLINLRHIFCSSIMKFPNIGRLTSLQTTSKVCVSNERGCDVKQLRNLNKLRGSLEISGLENVKSKEEALQANLATKERLTDLRLSWRDFHRRNSEVEAEVLEGMCPPVGLERLEIYFYRGSRYPDWMVGKQNGGPKDLQELKFRGCSQRGPGPKLVEAFPHLHVLHLVDCSWDALPGDMEHLSLLKKLCIWDCCNIRSLPTLPLSLEEFLLVGCNAKFTKSCEAVGHENWKKIEHIPTKHFDADSDDYDEIESLDSNGIAPQEL
uniref:Uncharacterized protein n=1 Tax=Avena sativa TaxID=4498 RepID=A0ACD5W4V8_AVESA